MRVAVHVTPRASKDEVAGWRGNELLVRVTAPPEGGKANEAVCRTLAAALGLPRGAVAVVSGRSSRRKLVDIDAEASVVADALGAPDRGLF